MDRLVMRSDAELLVREKPELVHKWGCKWLWEALPTPDDRKRSPCFRILSAS